MKAIKKRLIEQCFFYSILLVFLSIANAADHYVAPDGSADWASSINVSTPCSPVTAMKNAQAGDVVYFRGGVYHVTYDLNSHDEIYYWHNGALNPSHSGTAQFPITFMAYPGELPVIDVEPIAGWDNGFAFGVGGQNYIVYDGFKVIADGGQKMGGIKIQGESENDRVIGNVIRNCIIDGGSSIITTTDNREGIRIDNSSGTIVENCILYNFRQINNWHNTSAFKMYNNDNLIIRNCEIYNASTGIYLKSNNDNVQVYNNFIHDCYMGGMIATYLSRSSDNISIFNNVIVNNIYSGFGTDSEEESHANNQRFYNNTLYNTGSIGLGSGKCTSGQGAVVYNNVFPSGVDHTFTTGYTGETVRGYLKECDHNQWTTTFKITVRANGTHEYTSLSTWQTSSELEGGGNPGMGSLASDPKFVNSSGTMSKLEDFRLAPDSPCRGAGRNGADMGANIDLVGVKTGNSGGSPPPNPDNLRKLSQ